MKSSLEDLYYYLKSEMDGGKIDFSFRVVENGGNLDLTIHPNKNGETLDLVLIKYTDDNFDLGTKNLTSWNQGDLKEDEIKQAKLRYGKFGYDCPFCTHPHDIDIIHFSAGEHGFVITCGLCKKQFGVRNPFADIFNID